MGHTAFQALAICVILLSVALSIRRQRKSQEMPFAKYWFVYAIAAWCAGCFLYGIIFFVDAPFHESTPQSPCVNAAFCGKDGTPHTREEFEAFVAWQNMLILSWLVGLPTMWIASWVSKRQKAVSASSEQ
jgi:hypothetical protein